MKQATKAKSAQDEEAQEIRGPARQKAKSKADFLPEEGSDGQEKENAPIESSKTKEKGRKTQMTTVTRLSTSTLFVDAEKATYPASTKNVKGVDALPHGMEKA